MIYNIDISLKYLFFYFFAIQAIVFSLFIITRKNPVHSIFWLICVFFNASGIMITHNIDFIGIIFFIVYIGALAVLFLFAVMMLDLKNEELYENILFYYPVAILVILVLWSLVTEFLKEYASFSVTNYFHQTNNIVYDSIFIKTSVEHLGLVLYTEFGCLLIISGMLLLLTIVGAIALTLESPSIFLRQQVPYIQVSRNIHKSVILVKDNKLQKTSFLNTNLLTSACPFSFLWEGSDNGMNWTIVFIIAIIIIITIIAYRNKFKKP